MVEPVKGESPDKRPAETRKSKARWPRKIIVGVIGAVVVLAGLTFGEFGLFTRAGSRDPGPSEFQPDDAGAGGAYYRIRVDYLPRQGGDPAAAGQGWARRLGASLFDEGLTTAIAIEVAFGQEPVKPLARWRGDKPATVKGPFTVYRAQDQATIAVTITRSAQPRLRWTFGTPQWIAGIFGALVPRAGADQPSLIRIAPTATGQPPPPTTIVVRDYKGAAIGDLHVTSAWRSSVLFDPALVRASPTPNPVIAAFMTGNAGAAALKSAVLRTIRTTGADFAGIAAIEDWAARRFAAGPGDGARCAQTYDAAVGQLGLSNGDAALLTYFLHGPKFAGAESLTAVCGRETLGAALIRIGVPPPAKPAPVKPPPKAVAVAKPPPAPRLSREAILRRLAREWQAGLATRAVSTRFIRADARLVRPNRFRLPRPAPLTSRAAILDELAASPVRNFACVIELGGNSMAAIVERQQGVATAVYRYRFLFDQGNRIREIQRRPAIQADLNELKRTQRGTACTDRFLAREEIRLRQIIGGEGFAKTPPTAPPAAQYIIESNVNWTSPAPRGRARNRVTVDPRALDAIR